MKELVRLIFGNEAADDNDIVDFYIRVNKEALEQYTKWISVKDELPEEGKYIIGWTANGKCMTISKIQNDWHINKYNITHWMYPIAPVN